MIISTAELSKYFGKEVTPAKMKEQIMALLDEWKEKQPPRTGEAGQEKGLGKVTGPPLLDTLSRGKRPALGMGSVVIYPPSPPLFLHSREVGRQGCNAPPARGGLPLTVCPGCATSSGAAGGIYPPEPPPFPG